MKSQPCFIGRLRWIGFLAVLVLSGVSAQADPIDLPEKPITPEVSFLIGSAILLEVICIWLILRRCRKPRFFILWLIGMHALTYPGFFRLLLDMRPAFAVAIGEGLVVIVEGWLIYLICTYFSSAKTGRAAPSLSKCWLASLIGNLCSAVAFPVLTIIYEAFIHL
jgi:hypothetical protein